MNITCQDRFALFHKQCALVNNELPRRSLFRWKKSMTKKELGMSELD